MVEEFFRRLGRGTNNALDALPGVTGVGDTLPGRSQSTAPNNGTLFQMPGFTLTQPGATLPGGPAANSMITRPGETLPGGPRAGMEFTRPGETLPGGSRSRPMLDLLAQMGLFGPQSGRPNPGFTSVTAPVDTIAPRGKSQPVGDPPPDDPAADVGATTNPAAALPSNTAQIDPLGVSHMMNTMANQQQEDFSKLVRGTPEEQQRIRSQQQSKLQQAERNARDTATLPQRGMSSVSPSGQVTQPEMNPHFTTQASYDNALNPNAPNAVWNGRQNPHQALAASVDPLAVAGMQAENFSNADAAIQESRAAYGLIPEISIEGLSPEAKATVAGELRTGLSEQGIDVSDMSDDEVIAEWNTVIDEENRVRMEENLKPDTTNE